MSEYQQKRKNRETGPRELLLELSSETELKITTLAFSSRSRKQFKMTRENWKFWKEPNGNYRSGKETIQI